MPINKEAQAEYIISELSENKWVPQHRFVRYDKEKGFEGLLIPNDEWFEAEEKWNRGKWMPFNENIEMYDASI